LSVEIARARHPDKRQSMIEACARLLRSGDQLCVDALTLVQATVTALSASDERQADKGLATISFHRDLDFQEVEEIVARLGIDPGKRGAAKEVAQEMDRLAAKARKARGPVPGSWQLHLSTIRNILKELKK
jgi:hypothetical protein